MRPGWSDSYWKGVDKETAKKLRTTCPKCGSNNTYYNKKFRVWRCARCEHSFAVKGYGEPWWRRLMFWKR